MSNIAVNIMIAIMALIGGASSLYILVSLPAVLLWKCYRVAVKKCKFMD